MGNGSGVSRGDRNRNARLDRLRVLVPVTNAIAGIDLAYRKQMVVVTDHDSKVIARRMFRCRAWDLGAALGSLKCVSGNGMWAGRSARPGTGRASSRGRSARRALWCSSSAQRKEFALTWFKFTVTPAVLACCLKSVAMLSALELTASDV